MKALHVGDGRKTVIYVGSPFRGENGDEQNRNVKYARECARAVALFGFVPWAPHLHDPQFLQDNVPEERKLGLDNGKELMHRSDGCIFFLDRGTSDGMKGEISFSQRYDIPTVFAMLEGSTEALHHLVDLILEKRHADVH